MTFSFGLCLLAGQNYNLRYKIEQLEGTADGSSSSSNANSNNLTNQQVEIMSKEVGRLASVYVMEELTAGFLGSRTMGEDGVERVRVRVEQSVTSVWDSLTGQAAAAANIGGEGDGRGGGKGNDGKGNDGKGTEQEAAKQQEPQADISPVTIV